MTMMRRGARKSVLLFAASIGLVLSLTQTPSPALEVCVVSSATPFWGGFDRNMDQQYKWWAAKTQGGCISIIFNP